MRTGEFSVPEAIDVLRMQKRKGRKAKSDKVGMSSFALDDDWDEDDEETMVDVEITGLSQMDRNRLFVVQENMAIDN